MRQSPLPFLKNRRLLELIDGLAKRYGKLPTEVMALSVGEWSLNLEIAAAGSKAEAEQAKRIATSRKKR